MFKDYAAFFENGNVIHYHSWNQIDMLEDVSKKSRSFESPVVRIIPYAAGTLKS